MRTRTFAVLFVCWGLLSALAWSLCKPAIFDWTAQVIGGRVDPERAALIASISASVVPFVAPAVVLALVFLLARPTRRKSAARAAAPSPKAAPLPVLKLASRPAPSIGSTRPARAQAPAATAIARVMPVTKRIYIKPAKTLVNSGARFGVLLLENGAPAPNQEIYFKRLGDRGMLMAQVPCNTARPLKVKCFVDYKGSKFEHVKRALAASRFTVVSPRADKSFRAWFLLPGRAVDSGSGNVI